MLNSLLTTITTFSQYDISAYNLNWIGKFIRILIESFGGIGVGIIVFTLILKLITLPLDIYSRVSSKKMALKQEAMKPELERLQRQYANNKELYQKKMSALYKKQGVSMLSSCLPMIVTLVFFIIVINQFTAYSNYTNLSMINAMTESYNKVVENYDADNGTNFYSNVVKNSDGTSTITLNDDEIYAKTDLPAYDIAKGADGHYFSNDINKLGELVEKYNAKGFTRIKVGSDGWLVKSEDGTYSFNRTILSGTDEEINVTVSDYVADYAISTYVTDNIKAKAREAAAATYSDMAPSFLWVKNLWVPDLPWQHPVKATITDYNFKGLTSKEATEEQINQFYEVTANLDAEKKAPNGFLILVVLSIGVMLLSQLVMQKTQKTQMQLSSVDGQGASTQKMMTWMLPIMFGVFAFIYNASFSLYMIISSAFSTLSTVIINKIVEKSFKKKAEEEALKNDKRFFKK